MNPQQKELVRELEQEVKKRFPDAIVDGYWEKNPQTIAIHVSTPRDEIWEIAESLAPLSVDILSRHGYLIYVVPGTRDGARVTEPA